MWHGVWREWHCRLWRKGLGESAAAAGFYVGADGERSTPRRALRHRVKTWAHHAIIDGFDLPMRPTLVVPYPPTETFLGWCGTIAMNQGWSHVILSRMQNADTSVSPRPFLVSRKRWLAVWRCVARGRDRAGVRGGRRCVVAGRRRGRRRLYASRHAVGFSLADASQRRATQLCGSRGESCGAVGGLGTQAVVRATRAPIAAPGPSCPSR